MEIVEKLGRVSSRNHGHSYSVEILRYAASNGQYLGKKETRNLNGHELAALKNRLARQSAYAAAQDAGIEFISSLKGPFALRNLKAVAPGLVQVDLEPQAPGYRARRVIMPESVARERLAGAASFQHLAGKTAMMPYHLRGAALRPEAGKSARPGRAAQVGPLKTVLATARKASEEAARLLGESAKMTKKKLLPESLATPSQRQRPATQRVKTALLRSKKIV